MQDNGCNIPNFIATVEKFQYYVVRDGTLQFFDKDDKFLISMSFLMDLASSQAEKQKQQALLAEVSQNGLAVANSNATSGNSSEAAVLQALIDARQQQILNANIQENQTLSNLTYDQRSEIARQ